MEKKLEILAAEAAKGDDGLQAIVTFKFLGDSVAQEATFTLAPMGEGIFVGEGDVFSNEHLVRETRTNYGQNKAAEGDGIFPLYEGRDSWEEVREFKAHASILVGLDGRTGRVRPIVATPLQGAAWLKSQLLIKREEEAAAEAAAKITLSRGEFLKQGGGNGFCRTVALPCGGRIDVDNAGASYYRSPNASPRKVRFPVPARDREREAGIQAVFAHSDRVSEDQPQADGSVKKVAIFRHQFFYTVEGVRYA